MLLATLLAGGLLGIFIGGILAGGMAAVAGLPVYGPVQNVVAALIALGPAGVFSNVIYPIGVLFSAGLGLFAATIFLYVGGAIGFLIGVPPIESFWRGSLVGAAGSANLIIMSAIPYLFIIAPLIFLISIASLIPIIAINRLYQRVLGALGWVLPLNYLMLPLGVLLFLISAPFALTSPGGSVRWDWLTWSIETSGGFILASLGFAGGFNIGNFTFISGGAAPSPFTSGISAHETGHTLGNAAFGGFFYWIGAVDENVVPLRRSFRAYAELLAEGHFGPSVGRPFIAMW